MAVVIDNFVNKEACTLLLKEFPLLETGVTRTLPTVRVPLELEKRMYRVLKNPVNGSESNDQASRPPETKSINEHDAMVPFVARIASGSVPMHRDCFNPFDASETGFIDGYVAVLYLAGAGSFVIDAGCGEQSIDIVPGRFIAWPNGVCSHRLDAASESDVRAMLGPVAVDADGLMQRAHDVWSTHPGYIGYCQNQAKEAEAKGDEEGVFKALGQIGIPAIAEQLLKEYEERTEDKVCMTLSLTSTADAFVLIGSGISGERLLSLDISEPANVTYGDVSKTLRQEFSKVSDRAAPTFVLPDATLLGEAHNDVSIQELFNLPASTGAAGSQLQA